MPSTDSMFDALFELSFFGAADTESLLIVHLNERRQVIDAQLENSASPDQIQLRLRKIVADALAFQTHSLLIAHNHPSGNAQPSRGDVRQTRQLEKALHPLNIGFEDHLIFAGNKQFSFRAAGLL